MATKMAHRENMLDMELEYHECANLRYMTPDRVLKDGTTRKGESHKVYELNGEHYVIYGDVAKHIRHDQITEL